MIQGLAAWLNASRHRICRKITVLEPRWDPTYGQLDPAQTEIEVIDFDALLQEIDDFEASFRQK